MNLVVFGEDMYTAAVIESLVKAGHKVSLLVTPDSTTVNFKVLEEITANNGIDFLKAENINAETVAERIRSIKPDLIISAHLRKILKKEIFSLAAKGAVNVHPSLLPKYRGLSPQHQAIMHGDSESGVTVHLSGGVLAKQRGGGVDAAEAGQLDVHEHDIGLRFGKEPRSVLAPIRLPTTFRSSASSNEATRPLRTTK